MSNRLTKMINYISYNKRFAILLLVFLGSCGVPKSDYETLKEENENLKKELTELHSKINEIQYLKNHSEVALTNTELLELASSYTGQKYKIKIKLPRGYEKGTEKYPVLYVTDAETNFGGVSYIVQRLIKDKLIPPILVVGIAYGTDYRTFYSLRSRDLTPTEDKNLRMGGKVDPTGGADNFSRFLKNELFPFIQENYRVRKENRALFGHSYGGLYGCYVFLNQPELFNKYLLLSPSLWYDDYILLSMVKNTDLLLRPTKLFLASGKLEGRIDTLQVNFVNSLKTKDLRNLSLKSEVLENETHRTIFGPGFTDGLRFIYKDYENQ
ncbi:MAG: alpha/beta hydrolase-fold protein [Calditrichota bacterium]|jgi:predicted alpha/beta superfamily hydrolase